MSVGIMLAVNDPRNGQPTGRVHGLEIPPETISLEAPHPAPLGGISRRRNLLRIAGTTYRYLARVPWYGNWCWDLVEVSDEDAVDILDRLRKSERWTITAGEHAVFDKWERGEKISAADLELS